jgi:hypothetical protein
MKMRETKPALAHSGAVGWRWWCWFLHGRRNRISGPGDQWERRTDAVGTILKHPRFEVVCRTTKWTGCVMSKKDREKDVASEPYPQVLGESNERGGPAGMIVRHGYIVTEWGDVIE